MGSDPPGRGGRTTCVTTMTPATPYVRPKPWISDLGIELRAKVYTQNRLLNGKDCVEAIIYPITVCSSVNPTLTPWFLPVPAPFRVAGLLSLRDKVHRRFAQMAATLCDE